MKEIEIIFRLDGIEEAAERFLKLAGDYRVWAFSGELGAGKTTFISSLCRKLGVQEVISSPTFAIVQQYTTTAGENIYHMDLYRIKDDEDAIHSGLEDCLLSGDICMVEWPENAPGIFPEKTVKTRIEITEKQDRKLILRIPE